MTIYIYIYIYIYIKICELIWKIRVCEMFNPTLKMRETLKKNNNNKCGD